MGTLRKRFFFHFLKESVTLPACFHFNPANRHRTNPKIDPLTATHFFTKTVTLLLHNDCIFTSPFSRISLLKYLHTALKVLLVSLVFALILS